MTIFLIFLLVSGFGMTFLILTIFRAAGMIGICPNCQRPALEFVYVYKVNGRVCLACEEKILHVKVMWPSRLKQYQNI
jgi:hypothetical protein